MGDAGYILFGAVGREILSWGTIIFAVFATGGQLLAGQIALGVLSDNKLCLLLYTGIFAIPTFLFSLPRTLDNLSWLSLLACLSILIAGVVGMVGAGLNPVEGREIAIAVQTDFDTAFISITNPVFAYAGTFSLVLVVRMGRFKQCVSFRSELLNSSCALCFETDLHRAFHVLRSHLRDAPTSGRDESMMSLPSTTPSLSIRNHPPSLSPFLLLSYT